MSPRRQKASKKKASGARSSRTSNRGGNEPVGLRIIGGKFRGRKLRYGGDRRVRPMKHRIREAIFNLVGPAVAGKHAIDLFAGTGALGLEAISRGATQATFIEQHFPTAAIIRQNIASLELDAITELATSSVFIWLKRRPELGNTPWVVFCSPPYEFYVSRTAEMLDLIGTLIAMAPPGSRFVVESDERFDFGLLPNPEAWDVRRYAPAVVGLLCQ